MRIKQQKLSLGVGTKFYCPRALTIDFISVQSSQFYTGFDHIELGTGGEIEGEIGGETVYPV